MNNATSKHPPICKICGRSKYFCHISNINPDFVCSCFKAQKLSIIDDLKDLMDRVAKLDEDRSLKIKRGKR